ncbi:MAG: nitronate monooxygenase [Firmicutes bacterium]|nr:nitronate monooxygenase [Bacillota bacterium]
MIKDSKICKMLGIKYPIFQGPMAWISDAPLAAAVSNAGGLGIISAGMAPPEWVRDQVKQAKKLTKKPFALNVLLVNPDADKIADIVIEEGVRVVTTGAGSPAKYMKKWKEAGVIVIPVIASVALARMMQRSGADAVVAEGMEAGGHVGETTTMCLIPQVVDALDIPVIAAGGIADWRGVAAVRMLGADAVQLGTRFLVAAECRVHPNFKQMVLNAKDISTIVTGKRLGHPVRSLKTTMSRDFFQKEYDTTISNEELEDMAKGTFRKAVEDGDEEGGCFLCGQIAGMVKREQTCKEIIEEIFDEVQKRGIA